MNLWHALQQGTVACLLVLLFAVPVSAQSPTTLQLIEQALASAKTTQEAATAATARLQTLIASLEAMRQQLLPIDCVLGEPQLETLGEWSPWTLQPDGKTEARTREDVHLKPILTEPKNGGAPCGERTVIVPVTETRPAPQVPAPPPPTSEAFGYFNALASRSDALRKHALRTQAEIDSIEHGGANVLPGHLKWPIYDQSRDAMLQRTQNGFNAVQLQPLIGGRGASLLVTYDVMVGPGAEYKGEDYLKQYKSYRLDAATAGSGDMWLTGKLKFQNNTDETGEPAIAELLWTTSPKWLGPGTTTPNSEIIQPRLKRFWLKVNTWTRIWILLEGRVGGGPVKSLTRPDVSSDVVFVTVYVADETREPVLILDRVQMYAPVTSLNRFRFEYNTSETQPILNPVTEFWGRGYVVLAGTHLTRDVLAGMLQKPVR